MDSDDENSWRENLMVSHPNRSKKNPKPGRNPSPEEIKKVRKTAGLTQEAAAKLVYKSTITWKTWEAGTWKMAPDTWELFQIKVKDLSTPDAAANETGESGKRGGQVDNELMENRKMEPMTILRAIDILGSLNRSGSVDSEVAYLFTKFVNEGRVPSRPESPMTTEKRHLNVAISYAKEYLENGKVTD